jgi:hypothetical protein
MILSITFDFLETSELLALIVYTLGELAFFRRLEVTLPGSTHRSGFCSSYPEHFLPVLTHFLQCGKV